MIGRIEEQKLLLSLLEEDEPQFVAVFGRRRIGKTYLVREVFQHRFTFQHTGVSNADLSPGTRKRNQLEKLKESLTEAGYNSPEKLKSWNDAFNGLKEVIRHSSERKKAIFKLYTGTKYTIHPTLSYMGSSAMHMLLTFKLSSQPTISLNKRMRMKKHPPLFKGCNMWKPITNTV